MRMTVIECDIVPKKTGFRTSLLCLCIVGGSQCHVDHLWNPASGADKKSENVSNWMAHGNYVSFCGEVGGILWFGDVSVPCLKGDFRP